MTISTTDLKIYRSQRNRDTADGGGAMSPNEIIDGEINNIYDDISSQDRVTGRVSIRKGFAGVFSDNVDRYFGAGLVIVAPAQDPAVDVLMTSTGSFTDERADVVSRIESYLIPGATITWRLFNNHLAGTGALTLYGSVDSVTPDLGETLFLESTSGELSEAVKIQQVVSRSTQTFFDDQGAFQRDVLILQLTRQIQEDFNGTEVLRATTGTPPTRLRSSTVSAGANYKGVKLADDVEQGDTTIKVDNPFSRIVPSTRAESPLTDERASLSAVSFAKVGADDAISVSTGSQSFTAGETKSFYLGGTVFPGSLAITGTATATDNGSGVLSFAGSQTTGVVDYETGEVSITRLASGSASFSITATPGAAVSDSTLTTRIRVTTQTRANNYIRTLRPLPAPGTIAVDYRALDNWFRLRDDGNGGLAGAQPGEGGGNINYATGTLTATLSALPDVDTDIIISWGTGVTISDESGSVSVDAPRIQGTLSSNGIVPGTLTFEYEHSAATVTIEDDGDGTLQVQGTTTAIGRIIYATGDYQFRPPDWPDDGSNLVAAFDASPIETETFSPTPTGPTDTLTFTLAEAPRAGSLRLQWPVTFVGDFKTYTITATAADDGAGGIRFISETGFVGGPIAGASVNYTTGQVVLPAAASRGFKRPSWAQGNDVDGLNNPVVDTYSTQSNMFRFQSGSAVTAQYQDNAATTGADTETITVPTIAIKLAPLVSDSIVPGSVRFTFNGRTYVDRQGDLVYDPAVATNAGTLAGTVNYSTGRVVLTGYSSSGTWEANVVGLGSVADATPSSRLFFRTPAAPIAQNSLTVQANRLDTGALIQATADLNGDISAPGITGFVDTENGIAEVRFGELVTAAGNEAEWWYDAGQVDGDGNIFRPIMIAPGSAFFSAVAFVSIPLDPQILGLDPIRLPSDGRVPVFRPGDTLVVSQRNSVEVSSPSAGATSDLGINNVRWVRVKDSTGAEVLSEHYTVNGETGDLIWSNPLDLASYTGPYTLESMAYFMRLCTDVQINGTIGMGAPAPFAMANTDAPVFLSSKLIFTPDGGNQDLQGLVTNFFTQQSWTSEWSNEQIGSGTIGQYDDATYPITMRNDGSITERWRLEFVSSTTVNVIGERLGQILTAAPIGSAIAPVNPATGQPYFSIAAAGWSGGWVIGNTVRFNTLGANFPVWLIRSTQPGDPEEQVQDQFIAHLMGDIAQ